MSANAVVLENVTKIYNRGKPNQVQALTDISLSIMPNTMVCLKGASGSGKSTLLSIIGCLFPPSAGTAIIGGKKLSRLPDKFLTIHRRNIIGFIFQRFNILSHLTVIENITLPLYPLGVSPEVRKNKAIDIMGKLAIEHRAKFYPGQISGGELQRVAIARALINDPPIILADEPTAHLDSKLSRELLAILSELKKNGKTIIIASHDQLVTEYDDIDRIVDIVDGRAHVH